MKEKRWDDYSNLEKKQLLNHWLEINITEERSELEIKECKRVIEENTNDVYRVALSSYLCGTTIEPLIEAVRNKKTDELFLMTIKKEQLDEVAVERYVSFEQSFINLIVDSYNEKHKNKTKTKIISTHA